MRSASRVTRTRLRAHCVSVGTHFAGFSSQLFASLPALLWFVRSVLLRCALCWLAVRAAEAAAGDGDGSGSRSGDGSGTSTFFVPDVGDTRSLGLLLV